MDIKELEDILHWLREHNHATKVYRVYHDEISNYYIEWDDNKGNFHSDIIIYKKD